MGKAKKSNSAPMKNVALDKQLTEGKVSKHKNRDKCYLRSEESSVLDSKTSRKILTAAKRQQLELNEENFPSLGEKKSVNFNFGKHLTIQQI